jgi:halogenation protein CepH
MNPDVLVIGGGPAGAVTAAILAKEGLKVVLFEQERFPRHHVGESLQPATIELLDRYLGLGPELAKQGFARKYGAVYVWGETRHPWSVLFDSRLEGDLPSLDEAALLAGPYQHAWQVLRERFDAILLNEAVRAGVDVREQTAVSAPVLEDERVVGVRLRSGETVRANLVVDASGQSCVLGRKLGLHADVPDMHATATYAYYDGAGGVPGPLGRHVQLVVTLKEGWAWFIPVSAERTSIGIVSRERGRMSPERFTELLSEAELPIGQGVQVVDPDGTGLHFARDWSFAQRTSVGPGFIMVGDSACFVDPILSGGVDFAVRGACNAALAILTGLRSPEDHGKAFAGYDRRLREEYRAYLRLARYWYGNNRSVQGFFWEAHSEIPVNSMSTPLRAFVYLTSGQHAADQHYQIFEQAQEQKIFRSLGVDKRALSRARQKLQR